MKKLVFILGCFIVGHASASDAPDEVVERQSFVEFVEYIENNIEDLIQNNIRFKVGFECKREGISQEQWSDMLHRIVDVLIRYKHYEGCGAPMLREIIDIMQEAYYTTDTIDFGGN